MAAPPFLRRSDPAAAAVYAVGAAVYYVILRWIGVTFDATPGLFGVIALAAAVFRPRLVAPAVLLLVWGAAVLLVRHGPLPDEREAAVFMTAFGIGLALLWLLRRLVPPVISIESAVVVLIAGGIAFYGAYQFELLRRPWIWSTALLLNALALAGVAWRSRAD